MKKHGQIVNLWLLEFFADFTAIVAAYYITLWIRFDSAWGQGFFESINQVIGIGEKNMPGAMFEVFYSQSAPRIILFLTAAICILYALRNLYSGRRFIRTRPVAWNVIVANVTALLLFYAYFYLRRNVFHPRSFFATFTVFNIVLCVSFRGLMAHFLDHLREKFGIDKCKALLVGKDEGGEILYGLVQSLHPHGMEIVSRMDFDPDKPFEVLVRQLDEETGNNDIDMLILADKRFTVSQIMEILEFSDKPDIPVKVYSDKMNVLMNRARIPVDVLGGLPLVHFDASSSAERLRLVRSVVSLLFCCMVMVVAIPVMLVTALLVKLSSRGPVFFIQERIGVNRKPFPMYKFRTMHERSDELQAQVEEFNESGDGLFKIRKDPRVTPMGRFLRRFSLDELPQLINVLLGKMTIVGPRPLPRRDFENYYEDWHYGRHAGLPGLTCLWQISGRSEIDFHNMCILDVYYLRNQSWALDLKVILKTFWVVLFAKGAY